MKEEKDLMKSIDNNEWKSVVNLEEMKNQLKTAAKKTLLKDQRMNIRIAKRDLEGLKTRALEEGLPYQTLVSSILHKYVTGKLREKEV
ncbi:MAG: antitoxin [Treponema sp.]|jgi:predicted DNA binding CopG/RHH family protein|nr:antitoxin [Treponema sp.]